MDGSLSSSASTVRRSVPSRSRGGPWRARPTQASDDDPTLLGARLSTTGPDGTVYTLKVPDGALATETTVTMTPWKSATGTGLAGGRPFGVRLTPSGTEFLLPVTLRIDAPGR